MVKVEYRGYHLRVRRAALLTLGIVLLGLLTASPADGASKVLRVTKLSDDPPNGCSKADCSLREAVIRSNQTTAVERIVLGAGTHLLTIAGNNEDGAETGDLDIRRPVTISGQPEATPTLIDQTTNDRVMHVLGKGTLSLIQVNLTGGTVFGRGGGLLVGPGRKVALTRSAVTFNTAQANGGGGGIYTEGPLKMVDSFVFDNDTPFEGGGLMAVGANVSILRSAILGNAAGGGGGIGGGGVGFLAPGRLSVVDSTIEGNSSGSDGGGIWLRSLNLANEAPFTMLRSTVADNTTGGSGGGLFITKLSNQDTLFSIDDSTISGNTANITGGGLSCGCPAPAATITHTTIVDNTADADNDDDVAGGGEGGALFGSGVQIQILASIIGGNHDPGDPGDEDCGAGGNRSMGSNVTTEASCFVNPVPPTTDAIVGLLDFLGPLEDNGGPTETHAIADTSTAQDRHDGTGCGGTDQRGVPRPRGTDCDSGAYEYTECAGTPVDIVGTPRRDILTGTATNDSILALGGNDVITADAGDDKVCGGNGNDRLSGDAGADTLLGERGNDRLEGGTEIDACVGGPGRDRLTADCEPL